MDLKNQDLCQDKLYINGNWCLAHDGANYAVINPANGTPIAQVASAGTHDTQEAIVAAEQALPGFAALVAQERSALLRRWHDLILANAEDLALLITSEMGKPLAEARAEVAYGASFVEWFAEEAKRIYGDIIPPHQQDKRILVLKQPIGVCAAITPWNFPIAMITRKVAPALAAGCTVIAKPAGVTPLSALALAQLADQAGLPPGVFNVLPSARTKEVGAELTANPTVRKLTFTGSTMIGKVIYEQCAANIKKLSLELGGNAPFIVFDDADLDAAVAGAIVCKFRNTGQTCVCANRIYVQEGIFTEFASALAERVAALKVGPGVDVGIEQGPLVNEDALAKVVEHVADAQAKGAAIMTGGQVHELGGLFYTPTVLTGVTEEMLITTEETFGPVAPLIKFSDRHEVISLANATPFGLAAYFYTRDLANAYLVAERLEAGIIGVNTGLISTAVAPFGGVKESGIGREGSKYGVDEFVEIKYVCLGGIT